MCRKLIRRCEVLGIDGRKRNVNRSNRAGRRNVNDLGGIETQRMRKWPQLRPHYRLSGVLLGI